MSTKQSIQKELERLEVLGIIDYYQLQSRMPGLRWSICLNGRAMISFSTGEVQAFIKGAAAAGLAMAKAQARGETINQLPAA